MFEYDLDPYEREEKYLDEGLIAEYEELFRKYMTSNWALQEMESGCTEEILKSHFYEDFDEWYNGRLEEKTCECYGD
jgi:hypothetical protein